MIKDGINNANILFKYDERPSRANFDNHASSNLVVGKNCYIGYDEYRNNGDHDVCCDEKIIMRGTDSAIEATYKLIKSKDEMLKKLAPSPKAACCSVM